VTGVLEVYSLRILKNILIVYGWNKCGIGCRTLFAREKTLSNFFLATSIIIYLAPERTLMGHRQVERIAEHADKSKHNYVKEMERNKNTSNLKPKIVLFHNLSTFTLVYRIGISAISGHN
jgi:hypothetical protein